MLCGALLQERWEVAASKLEAGSDSKHPKATCQGNIDDVLGSFKPFSQGSRECLGQVRCCALQQRVTHMEVRLP